MAYDTALADRIRDLLVNEKNVTEKKMFGGLAFLVKGNMAVAASGKGGILVRVDPEEGERALSEPNVRRFDLTGRPMKGWLLVGPAGLETDRELREWVDAGLEFAASLVPKQ